MKKIWVSALLSAALVAGTAAVPLCAATFEFACDRPDGATRMFPRRRGAVGLRALVFGIIRGDGVF